MKIQHYAIVFIIIILPFSIICKTNINKKIDTMNEQTRINNALDTATNDAIDTLIELNDEFYALSDGETMDVTPTLAKEALKTFFESLAVNNNLPFVADEKFAENYFSPYIPAIVIVAYDGFYIYSVEENGGTYEYVLSPKIPYAYEENGYVINFTLGNAIKLYAPNGILYEGDFERDFIDLAYIDYLQIRSILGLSTLANLPQLTTDMSMIMCALCYDASFTSHRNAYPIPDFLCTEMMDGKVSMLADYSETRTDDTGSTPTLDDDVSAFHAKRREVIINLIIKTLNEKINNHNRYADIMGVTYNFYLPQIDDAQWINAVDDVSFMAFMQGVPTGTDSYYNSFALGASRIIQIDYIYGTLDKKYHTSECIHLAHEFDAEGYPIGGGAIDNIFLNKLNAASSGYNPCLTCKP